MTYATLSGGEYVGARVSLATAKTVGATWRAVVHGRTDWLVLFMLFGGLQLADIVTTNSALALPGNWEANPLMALSQVHLGAVWWVPKAAAALLICLLAPLTRRRWPMVFAVAYFSLIVSGNLLEL